MKPLLFVITFLASLAVMKTDDGPIPSFLTRFGSYRYDSRDTADAQVTLKRYYISQRVTYTWIDAFMSCKSAGMQMASIETADEIKNLAAIARNNPKLFNTKVYVVHKENLTETVSQGRCYSVVKHPTRKLAFASESCNGESLKFLCERYEDADSYDDSALNIDSVDVKSSYLTHLGNFEEETTVKSYYASFTIKRSLHDAIKFCESLDMRLASPQSQTEYENVANLLRNFTYIWTEALIDGYRSEVTENDWVTANKNINYKIDWDTFEPNNENKNENCIAMREKNAVSKMNDIPCTNWYQFICEYDASLNHDKKFYENEISLFLKPLTSYNIGSHSKEIFVSLHEMKWHSAIITCKNVGMELMTPSSEEEMTILRNKLKLSGNDVLSLLHVGATNMDKQMWYSIHSGKVFDFDFEWHREPQSNEPETKCLALKKHDDAFYFDAVNCCAKSSRFLCQKFNERIVDEVNSPTTRFGLLNDP